MFCLSLTGSPGQRLPFGKRERDASDGAGASPTSVSPHCIVVAAAWSSTSTVHGRVGVIEVEMMLGPGGCSHAAAGIATGK